MKKLVLADYLKRAGSADFKSANNFAKVLPDLDASLAALGGEAALKLVAAMYDAADTGAWKAKNILANKFEAAPALRAKARAFAKANPKASTVILAEAGVQMKPPKFVANCLMPAEPDD